jgi:peptide/nickel transport system permease protein
VIGALALGALVGGLAGSRGGRTDSVLMLVADFVLVLPGVYLVLVLRAMLPILLSTSEVFWLMSLLFAVAGWPHVARGVRAIVATERARDYAEAARAAGAGPFRLLWHLLPATRGFLGVETVLLVPTLLVAEATISYLGLGFPEPTPSWGTMLRETENVRVMAEAPWMLAPAAALFIFVLGVQLVAGTRSSASALLVGARERPDRDLGGGATSFR